MPHARVERVGPREQLDVRAALGHVALLEHQYFVRVDDCREAVRDHQCRATLNIPKHEHENTNVLYIGNPNITRTLSNDY